MGYYLINIFKNLFAVRHLCNPYGSLDISAVEPSEINQDFRIESFEVFLET